MSDAFRPQFDLRCIRCGKTDRRPVDECRDRPRCHACDSIMIISGIWASRRKHRLWWQHSEPAD